MKQKFSFPEYDGPAIYEIVNLNNGRVYIGSCKDVGMRGYNHSRDLKAGRHHCKALQADYSKGDIMQMRIVKKIHTSYRTELRIQEGKEIDKRKRQGQELYNAQVITTKYTSRNVMYWSIADKYCRDQFGRGVDDYLRGNEAETEYRFKALLHPDQAEQLKQEYAEVIDYKNKADFYKMYYEIDYDEYIELPKEQRPKLKMKRFSFLD